VLLSIPTPPASAEGKAVALALNDVSQVRPHNVTVAVASYDGSDTLEVRQTVSIAARHGYIRICSDPKLP
jgi:hypothetical protein